MATLSDLLAYCKRQANISRSDYFYLGRAKPEEVAAWRRDCRKRDRARAYCFATFPARLGKGTEELVPGNYGRLTIEQDGRPDYTAGQYAPTEVYGYLFDYLKATN